MKERLFFGSAEKDGFYVSRKDDSASAATLTRIIAGMERPVKNTRFTAHSSPDSLIIRYKVLLLNELLKNSRINFWEIRRKMKKKDPLKYNREVFREACAQVLADLDIRL